MCYPDGCQPSASIMHSNNASTITIDATAFEAAGLTLSVTTVPLDEARDHWVGGLKAYALLKSRGTTFMGRMFSTADLGELA